MFKISFALDPTFKNKFPKPDGKGGFTHIGSESLKITSFYIVDNSGSYDASEVAQQTGDTMG